MKALESARSLTDRLFEYVRSDCLYDRPIPERHRIIFYRGHLEAFDWNLIARRVFFAPAFHPEFDRLFAFGIDPGPGNLPSDRASDWPTYDAVLQYCEQVREKLDALWQDAPEELRCTAIEHRLMHAETFAYMLHNLPLDKLRPPISEPAPSEESPEPVSVRIPAGTATLGRPRGDGFGWDNEFEEHTVDVPEFSISKYKVTNGEYLEYVKTGAPAPRYWRRHNGSWHLRCLFSEIPLPLDWPVYVTHAEASCYAAWIGQILPTEAQWQRAWGESDTVAQAGNFDFRHWDPVPVHGSSADESEFGVAQLTGNGWEWTSTVFGPFPGFRPYPFYPGYSADFFDDAHYVLKGASPLTAAQLARRSFRNWFRPNYPYIHASFRCAGKEG